MRFLDALYFKGTKIFSVILITYIVKFSIALIFPLSSDFTNIVGGSTFLDSDISWRGLYTFSIYFMNIFYRLWRLMPIPHPPPSDLIGYMYFKPSLSAFIFVGFFKFPLVLMDLLTGFLVYKIVFTITNLRDRSILALLIWVLNPYNIIMIEMVSSIDIIGTFFFIASIYFLIKDRFFVSAGLLAVSIIARFYPLLFFPFISIYLVKNYGTKRFLSYLSSTMGALIIFSSPYILRFGVGFFNWLYNLPLMGPKGHPEFTGFYGHLFQAFVMPFSQISLTALVYFIFLIIYLKFGFKDKIGLLNSVFLILIAFVTLSMYHYYHSIWLVPFLTIIYVLNKDNKKSNMILIILFFISLYCSAGFISGFNTVYLQSLRESFISFREFFYQDIIAENFFKTFFRSILLSMAVIFLIEAFFYKNIQSESCLKHDYKMEGTTYYE